MRETPPASARCAIALVLLARAGALDAGAAEPRISHALPRTAAHAAEIDWRTSALDLDLRGVNGARYAFRCPPGNPTPTHVVGSGPYTDNSSICAAAVHAGAIDAKDGGVVTIEIRPGEAHYAASERNYIRTAAYDHAWSGSFVVLRKDTATTP